MYWISALWIPLIPLGTYLVSPTSDGFRFHRKMGLIAFHRIYARKLPLFYLSVAGESLLLLMVIVLALVLLVFLMMGLRSIL